MTNRIEDLAREISKAVSDLEQLLVDSHWHSLDRGAHWERTVVGGVAVSRLLDASGNPATRFEVHLPRGKWPRIVVVKDSSAA